LYTFINSFVSERDFPLCPFIGHIAKLFHRWQTYWFFNDVRVLDGGDRKRTKTSTSNTKLLGCF